MRSGELALIGAAVCALACGGSSGTTTFHVVPGDNVLALSVNGAHCSSGAYVNKPCVSVTVCEPGTSTCQTIDDVLLDTGSFGLRLFKQPLTVSLQQVQASDGGSLAECVQFADGSSDWGPVMMADVVLANEPAVRVPIQVIDSTFGTVPGSCTGAETGPTGGGGNGILGVGAFVEDCGAPCARDAANGLYFSSSGSSTSGIAVEAASQVQNPAALLPVDGNGIIVALPSVPAAGAPSVEGSLVFGIGTRANNVPATATVQRLDGSGEFTTVVAGGSTMGGSFADTGSNGLFFTPPSTIPLCPSAKDFYCPATTLSFSATNEPTPGFPGSAARVRFEIANAETLVSRGNAVFSDLGGTGIANAGFDWGLPFFLGRTVYLGFQGRSSRLGTGPLLAY